MDSAKTTAPGYPGQDLESLDNIPHYYRWITRSFGSHLRGDVLELGAGTGNFTTHYLSQISTATLVEPDPRLHAELSARFAGDRRTRVLRGRIDDLLDDGRSDLGEGAFDAVVAVNVLEHIDDDGGTVRTLVRLLRPGGALLLFVPAMPALYGSLDAVFGHFRRYTSRSLRDLVTDSGLQIVSLRYFDVLGMLPWLIAGRLIRMRTFDRRAAVIYDRIAVPLLSRIEEVVPPPRGKNLVCVAIARSPGGSSTPGR